MGWGSYVRAISLRKICTRELTNFVSTVVPQTSLTLSTHSLLYKSMLDMRIHDTNYAIIEKVATQADICLAFVNSDSGEGYVSSVSYRTFDSIRYD